jgi:GntR family transcriptional regulator
VPLEFSPPKYAQVVNAVQERILDGTYPAGSMIPSESQLMTEFDASRPVVVRALGILQQDGWIDSRPGKGRFVRSRSSMAARQAPGQAVALLGADEAAGVKILKVGPVLSSPRIAAALNIEPGTPVIARERLAVAELGPVELATTYLPVELASRTDVGNSKPLPRPLLEHVSRKAGVEFDHATERISARRPTQAEAELLDIDLEEAVLTLLVTVYDKAGAPQVVVDAVIPASRHELDDAFPINL